MKFATTFVTVLAVVLGSSQASAAYKFCPTYWHLFDGECYRYFGDRVTFATAQSSCHNYYTNSGRAELASIHSNDVNSFLYDLFRSSAGDLPDGVRISFIQACQGRRKVCKSEAAIVRGNLFLPSFLHGEYFFFACYSSGGQSAPIAPPPR